jgi:hypothetical protein
MNIAMRPIVQAAAKSLHGVREHTDRPIVQCDNGVHLLRGLHELCVMEGLQIISFAVRSALPHLDGKCGWRTNASGKHSM